MTPSQLPFPEVLDSSMISTFKSCPQQFFKSHIMHWRSKEGVSVHLRAGGAFARGLEIARTAFFCDGLSAEDAEAKGLEALLISYGDFQCPADSAKSAERMAGALSYYFDMYPLNHTAGFPILLPQGGRAVEFNFAHELPVRHPTTGNPLLYCGRSDAIISYAGDTYICDEKTTSRLGPSWADQWPLRSQFMGYTWGCREHFTRVAGVLVRGISILKTKYETQEALCKFTDFEIDRWYAELLDWVTNMVLCYQAGRWLYNFDKSCADFGGCAFKDICKLEDETPWLRQYFEQRRWDPITREETLLG